LKLGGGRPRTTFDALLLCIWCLEIALVGETTALLSRSARLSVTGLLLEIVRALACVDDVADLEVEFVVIFIFGLRATLWLD
jgi:hypothetical protein